MIKGKINMGRNINNRRIFLKKLVTTVIGMNICPISTILISPKEDVCFTKGSSIWDLYRYQPLSDSFLRDFNPHVDWSIGQYG